MRALGEIAFGPQIVDEQGRNVGVVFEDEDARHGGAADRLASVLFHDISPAAKTAGHRRADLKPYRPCACKVHRPRPAATARRNTHFLLDLGLMRAHRADPGHACSAALTLNRKLTPPQPSWYSFNGQFH